MPNKIRKWTAREDRILAEGFQEQLAEPTGKGKTINWSDIAKRLPGRNNKDCRKRYLNNMEGSVKKGPWSKEEDTQLENLVNEHGLSWAAVSLAMGTRSADQCSKRWQHHLNPELDRQPWRDYENQLLVKAVKEHGTCWKDIQEKHFVARSANNIKNQGLTVAPEDPPCCPPQGHLSATPDSSGLQHMTDHQSQMDLADMVGCISTDDSEMMDALLHDLTSATNGGDTSLMPHDLSSFRDGAAVSYSDVTSRRSITRNASEGTGILTPPDLPGFGTIGFDYDEAMASMMDHPVSSSDNNTSNGRNNHNDLRWDFEDVHADASAPIESDISWPLDKAGSGTLGGSGPRGSGPGDGVGAGATASRMTIVVEGASSQTLHEVMEVLMESPARVEFRRG